MRRKIYFLITTIVFLVLIVLTYYLNNGINNDNHKLLNSNKQVKIQTINLLEWKCILSNGKEVIVNCYLFPKTTTLKKEYERQKKTALENIYSEKERIKNETRKDFLKAQNESLEILEQDFIVRFPNWDKWPNVFLLPILLEKKEPVKAILATNYKNMETDIIFTLYSEKDISDEELMFVAKAVTKNLEPLDYDDWKEFPINSLPIFNEEGFVNSSQIESFIENEDAVFLEQK